MKSDLKTIFQYSFIPLALLAVFAGGIYLTAIFDPRYYVVIPILINLTLVVFFVFSERLFPYRKAWSVNQGDAFTDGVQTFLVLPAASKLAEWSIPFLFYYPVTWLAGSLSFQMGLLTEEYGLMLPFIIALLCCEFFYYWFHRLCHTASLFWRFHAVHHGAGRVYWLNAGRFHGIEAFLSSMIYFLPLAFLGPDPRVVVLIISVSAVTGFLEHVNVDFKAGFLNYIFNTADLHRWHHSRIIAESNKNYGKVLVLWDQLFGTFFLPKDRQVEEAGIVENDVPVDFAGQLKYPFRRKK